MKDISRRGSPADSPSTKRALTEDEALSRLMRMCSTGEHCQQDAIDKLYRWGVDDAAQARIMQQLIDGKYIDDERYTRAFVHDKAIFDRWGRRKIEQALRLRHIPSSVYGPVIDDVDDEQWTESLRYLLERKRDSIHARNDYELRGKLAKYALQRGFTMDIIRQCLDDVPQEMDNDDYD